MNHDVYFILIQESQATDTVCSQLKVSLY